MESPEGKLRRKRMNLKTDKNNLTTFLEEEKRTEHQDSQHRHISLGNSKFKLVDKSEIEIFFYFDYQYSDVVFKYKQNETEFGWGSIQLVDLGIYSRDIDDIKEVLFDRVRRDLLNGRSEFAKRITTDGYISTNESITEESEDGNNYEVMTENLINAYIEPEIEKLKEHEIKQKQMLRKIILKMRNFTFLSKIRVVYYEPRKT